jgi:hypothetical protein
MKRLYVNDLEAMPEEVAAKETIDPDDLIYKSHRYLLWFFREKPIWHSGRMVEKYTNN